jgi:hypothetical protein
MKLKLSIIATLLFVCVIGCKKEEVPKKTYVKVQIDYIGSGGYYNDNINGVPSGLIVGTNGPYEIDPGTQYHLQYKAASNFPEITLDWTPTKGSSSTIHSYVTGNTEHIEVIPN